MKYDQYGHPLECEGLGTTGLLLLYSKGMFVIMDDGKQIAVVTINDLSHLYDQIWGYLVFLEHPITQQSAPSVYLRKKFSRTIDGGDYQRNDPPH